MPRRARPMTAKGKIIDFIRWAERQGFVNIATELREALALIPDPTLKQARRRD